MFLRGLATLYAAVVALGGSLRFFPTFPAERALWLLQLVVSELGLIVALPLLAIIAFGNRVRSRFSIRTVLASFALVLATLPVWEMIAQERNWVWDLEYGPGRDAKPDPRGRSPYIGELARPLFEFAEFFRRPVHPVALREEFETSDGAKLAIYVYFAPGGGIAKKPWVMSIHGGGWSNGDPRDLDQTVPALLEAGYTVIAPSYRFAPTYAWPRQMTDLETAYRYVIQNAERLRIDPERLWLQGRSAGGQLALKLAYGSVAVRGVKGVIALYSPTDLDFGYRWSLDPDVLDSRKLLSELIGGTPDQLPEKYRNASPLADAGSNSPPTLLITGRADPLVWYRHADRLTDRLRAAGARVTRIELPWGTHGFDYFPNSPGGQLARNAMLRFMERP